MYKTWKQKTNPTFTIYEDRSQLPVTYYVREPELKVVARSWAEDQIARGYAKREIIT